MSRIPRLPLPRGFLPRLARPILPISRFSTLPPLVRSRPLLPSFSRSFSLSGPRLTSPPPPSLKDPQTLSARLKTLVKSYGWYALGVYLILSALDFGVAFAAINLLGANYVEQGATSFKTFFFNLIGRPLPDASPDAPPHPGGHEGIYAMLVLAYTVHKTLFLPVRVGLTAAVTPRFVSWLGRRGWTGSEGARRAAREVRERVARGSRRSEGSD